MHSVDPATLESITLDDLQDVGQYPNGLPISEDHAADLRLIKESTRPDGSRGLVFPGSMRELLRPLQGRCSNLKSLYIRRCGQEGDQHEDFPTVWSNTAEEGAYMEYASFIDSVKSSLRSFHFEQGHQAPSPRRGTQIRQDIRPMDDRFRRFILPVILSGNWAKLQRLEIRGVGKWRGRPTINEAMVAQIKDAVGLHTKVIIADEAKSLWIFRGMGTNFEAVKHFGLAPSRQGLNSYQYKTHDSRPRCCYEKITNKEPKSEGTWAAHLSGALTLVNLRRKQQFKDPSALNILMRLSTNLLIRSMVSDRVVSAEPVELRFNIVTHLPGHCDPKWQESDLMVEFASLR
ncbi:hypothetical protein MMC34_003710 [Xylographa carneopallida]|nr:hypothetical protein [Xylographa carneopallida]